MRAILVVLAFVGFVAPGVARAQGEGGDQAVQPDAAPGANQEESTAQADAAPEAPARESPGRAYRVAPPRQQYDPERPPGTYLEESYSDGSGSDRECDSDAGWIIIGVGLPIGAATAVTGAALLAQDSTNAEIRLGTASLIAGLTGMGLSLVLGLIAM